MDLKPADVIDNKYEVEGPPLGRERRGRACRDAALTASWLGACLVMGCSPAAVHAGGYCAPPAVATFSFGVDPAPSDGRERMPQMAAILGLRGVTAEQAAQSPEIRARVVERVSLAIEATSAELDCESERARQAADYLLRGQTSAVQSLTVGSIVVAALTGIAGVFLSTRNASAGAQDAVAISGGTVTAGLGLSSLFVHTRVTFEHERNLLTDIWKGSPGDAYHPFVWAYLTRPEFSNSGQAAIRQKIVARWRQFHQVKGTGGATILFGRGGSYDADDLRLRATMLEEVNAEVELAHQDLAAFAAAMLR